MSRILVMVCDDCGSMGAGEDARSANATKLRKRARTEDGWQTGLPDGKDRCCECEAEHKAERNEGEP